MTTWHDVNVKGHDEGADHRVPVFDLVAELWVDVVDFFGRGKIMTSMIVLICIRHHDFPASFQEKVVVLIGFQRRFTIVG